MSAAADCGVWGCQDEGDDAPARTGRIPDTQQRMGGAAAVLQVLTSFEERSRGFPAPPSGRQLAAGLDALEFGDLQSRPVKNSGCVGCLCCVLTVSS
jgi:hypothetical protein